MVIACHCIFGMYGFWLRNDIGQRVPLDDPRGSGSDYVASWELFRYGPATKTRGRRSVAGRAHDRAARLEAKQALKFPPVIMTGLQAFIAAQGFAWATSESGYRIHACAVLPDHVHLVIGRHRQAIRKVIGHLKARATRLLRLRGSWPADERPVWGEHGWNVYLNTSDEVEQSIAYANENPLKEGLPRQDWSFVVPFEPGVALATSRESAVQAPRRNA